MKNSPRFPTRSALIAALVFPFVVCEVVVLAEPLAPEITVELATSPGVELDQGSRVPMGILQLQGSLSLDLVVKNTGQAPLTGIQAKFIAVDEGSPLESDFGIGPAAYLSTLGPGQETTVQVWCKDQKGVLEGRLYIHSNDADESPLALILVAQPAYPALLVRNAAGTALPPYPYTSRLGFGQVKVGQPAVLTFHLENPGSAPVTVTPFLDPHEEEMLTYFPFTLLSPETVVIPPGGSAQVSVQALSPTERAETGWWLRLTSDAGRAPDRRLLLEAGFYAEEPAFNFVTEAEFMVEGQTSFIEATAAGAPQLRYRWTKDGKPFNAGRDDGSVDFSPARRSDAGVYQARVTNSLGEITSPPIPVGIITAMPTEIPVESGKALTLKTGALLPPGFSVQRCFWVRESPAPFMELVDGELYSGTQTTTLTIASVDESSEGSYRCLFDIQFPSGKTRRVMSGFPVVAVARPPVFFNNPLDLVFSIGQDFYLNLRERSGNQPTHFSAKGLPPGLTLNPKTGVISGRPTAARVVGGQNVPYAIQATAFNGHGSSQREFPVLVLALPDWWGSFTGLIARHETTNEGLGGTLQMTLTRALTYSGRLTLGTRVLGFSGRLESGSPGSYQGLKIFPRSGTRPPVTLHFSVDISGSGRIQARVHVPDSAGDPLHAEGLLYSVTPGRSELVKSAAGYYTAVLQPEDGLADPEAQPEGSGIVAFTVRPQGTLSWTGRMADGSLLTGGAALGPGGELPFHQMLAVARVTGSVHGWANVSPDPGLVDAELTWFRPAPPAAAKVRLYPGGIPLHNLTLVGGRYARPAAGSLLVGADSTPGNALMRLRGGALDTEVLQPVTLTPRHTAVVAANPLGIKITSLNAATGFFSGSLAADDADPRDAAPPIARIKRAGTFHGVIVNRLGQGIGHHQLPILPTVPGAPPAGTPILSGAMTLEKTGSE